MQYPPNTVSITAKELDYISKQPETIVVCVVDENEEQWNFFSKAQGLMNAQCKFYINTHDYRHYFGEVVDLKEHVTGSVLQYMGDAFILTRDDEPNYYTLYECIDNGYPDRLILTDLESQCKKIVIDYFTALFKKDLPHLNIKFIWS